MPFLLASIDISPVSYVEMIFALGKTLERYLWLAIICVQTVCMIQSFMSALYHDLCLIYVMIYAMIYAMIYV